MSKKRRTFSNEQKFNIVIEALKSQRQISEIALEYDVHPNQITTWKKQFLEHGSSVFGKKKDSEKEDLEQTQRVSF